jgi:precorrin-6B methylase 2
MSLIVDEHRRYLADRARLDAYRQALAAAVRPGDIVIDVGSGTGILGLLACRAGASRVYAIEATGMIEIARALAADNGVADRMTFIPRHSTEARIPEPADVLVGDLAGRMGFEAGVFEVYRDARRLLKDDARVIPSCVTIHAAPVEHRAAHEDALFWRGGVTGVRTESVLRWALNTGYPWRYEPDHLLSSSAVSAAFPTIDAPDLLRIDGRAAIDRAGTVHGVGAWFTAQMAPGVIMTNAPAGSRRIDRRNVFLPIEHPVAVRAGDDVRIAIRIRPGDRLVSWSIEVRTGDGVSRERHSTLEGMLVTREDVRAHDPAARPRLTARGLARRTLLELCDGRRPLAEIELELQRRHPELFETPAHAQAFVAEVVTRYGEFGQD